MSLDARIVGFARLLRLNDFIVGTGQVHDALRAASAIDVADRSEFYLALRAMFWSDPERRRLFDDLFARFWNATEPPTPIPTSDRILQEQPSPAGPAGDPRLAYSPREGLYQRDFSEFTLDEMPAVAKACATLARKIATRRSRRFRPTTQGHRIDRRGSIRRNLKHGGTVVELARMEPKIRKPKVVLICDVSRSMEPYSIFLLHFIHSMQHLAGRVESFVFATNLHRVTTYFQRADITSAIDAIAQDIADWAGGTRIGQSLRTFNEEYAWRLVSRRTTVIVLSDGLDTGETDLLAEQMTQLRRSTPRIIWLNPLLESQSTQTMGRGMATALPHVDVFAPANNLASLQRLVRSLVRGRGGRGGVRAAAPLQYAGPNR